MKKVCAFILISSIATLILAQLAMTVSRIKLDEAEATILDLKYELAQQAEDSDNYIAELIAYNAVSCAPTK